MAKQPVSSNLQGLENDEPIPRGTSDETIVYKPDRQILSSEHQPTGENLVERSDIYRLQDEDFRLRVKEIESGKQHKSDRSTTDQHQTNVSEYDPVVHRDSKPGRLHLSLRYDNKQNQLIIQIIDAEGIIRPEQFYAPEMCVTLSLIGNDNKEYSAEKYDRIIVENAAVQWKEPVIFSISYEDVKAQNLYIFIGNRTDPSGPRDRELSIPLNNLEEEINNWYDLQYIKSA